MSKYGMSGRMENYEQTLLVRNRKRTKAVFHHLEYLKRQHGFSTEQNVRRRHSLKKVTTSAHLYGLWRRSHSGNR